MVLFDWFGLIGIESGLAELLADRRRELSRPGAIGVCVF